MCKKLNWEFDGEYANVVLKGKKLITGIRPGSVSDLRLKEKNRYYKDAIGEGKKTVLISKIGKIDADWELIEYENGKLGFRIILMNNTDSPIGLKGYSPFMTSLDKGGVYLEGHPAEWRVYRESGRCGGENASYGFNEEGGEPWSKYLSVLWSPVSNESISIGQVEVERSLTTIKYKYGENKRVVTTTINEVRSYWAHHDNITIKLDQDAEGYLLEPGEIFMLDLCMISFDYDPFNVLKEFADSMVKFNKVKEFTKDDIWTGWMTWYNQEAHLRGGYGTTKYDCASEEVTLGQSRFIKETGLKSYGIKDIIIDAGYQKEVHLGDWLEFTPKFPNGMDGLSKELKNLGMCPGVWLAPFVATEDSEVFKKHPEWFVKRKNGSLEPAWDWYLANPPVHAYEMDTTVPGAIEWLINIFKTFQKWGYCTFKNDFSGGLIKSYNKKYHNKKMTGLMRWRWTWRKIKEALEGGKYSIQLCGADNIGGIGIIDNVRTGSDLPPCVTDSHWNNIIKKDSSKSNINRWWQNKKFFIVDPDNLLVAEYKDYRRYENVADYNHKLAVSYDEARVRAIMVFAAGGNIILGDRLTMLEPERIDIIKKVLPVYGESSIPIDMFKHTRPYILWNHIKKPWGEWDIISVINYEEGSLVEEIPLQEIGLDAGDNHSVIELWSEEKVDNIKNGILRAVVKPHSVKTFRITKINKDKPVFVGSTFHITMGGVEVKEHGYDDEGNLNITIARPGKEEGKCFFWSAKQNKVISLLVETGPKGKELKIK